MIRALNKSCIINRTLRVKYQKEQEEKVDEQKEIMMKTDLIWSWNRRINSEKGEAKIAWEKVEDGKDEK